MRLPARKPRVGSTRLLPGIAMAIGCGALVLPSKMVCGQVTTAQYDNARTGANTRETKLTPRSVTAASFGKVATIKVDGDVYAQVLYLPSVTVPGKGTHPVVFVATEHNTLYALDADSNSGPNGGVLWTNNLGLSADCATAPFGYRYSGGGYTDIVPEVGMTATPVIDGASGTIYVDAFTRDIVGVHHHCNER